MKKRFHDISMTIGNDMVSWPSDGPVRVERVRSMDDGERLNQSRLDMSAHTGTHIDAPVHFIMGEEGVDSLDLQTLIGPAVVAHVPGLREISSDALKSADIPPGTQRLLLKTDNSGLLDQRDFSKEFTHVTLDGADHLVNSGIRLIGIDYLSIAAYGSGEEVHRALLAEGVIIIEGLDLRAIMPGQYRMTALPLKIAGCDGAPARVVLEENEES